MLKKKKIQFGREESPWVLTHENVNEQVGKNCHNPLPCGWEDKTEHRGSQTATLRLLLAAIGELGVQLHSRQSLTDEGAFQCLSPLSMPCGLYSTPTFLPGIWYFGMC